MSAPYKMVLLKNDKIVSLRNYNCREVLYNEYERYANSIDQVLLTGINKQFDSLAAKPMEDFFQQYIFKSEVISVDTDDSTLSIKFGEAGIPPPHPALISLAILLNRFYTKEFIRKKLSLEYIIDRLLNKYIYRLEYYDTGKFSCGLFVWYISNFLDHTYYYKDDVTTRNSNGPHSYTKKLLDGFRSYYNQAEVPPFFTNEQVVQFIIENNKAVYKFYNKLTTKLSSNSINLTSLGLIPTVLNLKTGTIFVPKIDW